MELKLTETIYTIFHAFSETEYGKLLNSKIRYERYNLSKISNKEWVNLLGMDVNNLWHMMITYSLAKKFIEENDKINPNQLSDTEKALIQVAAIIHDQGEALVGDISYSDKDAKLEEQEKQVFNAQTEAFTSGLTDKTKQLIIKARDEVVFESSTKLGRQFNAIERLGYMRTALRAGQSITNEISDFNSGLRWLVADVLCNHVNVLIEYSNEYASVSNYLGEHESEITDLFENARSAKFEYYGDTMTNKLDEFTSASIAWNKFKKLNQ